MEPPDAVGLGGVGWRLALRGEDSRGSARGQEMVGSEMRRGENVSMPGGNPPSRRDHRLSSPSGVMWDERAVS